MDKFVTFIRGLFVFIFIFCILLVINLVFEYHINNENYLNEITQNYKSYLGGKAIIDGDTLTIINYSIDSRSFTLSNNVVVDYLLICNYEDLYESKQRKGGDAIE